MTELDPSLVLKAFATPQLDVGNLLETRQQLKLRNLAQQKMERQEADAQMAQQRRQQLGGMAASGDIEGAQKGALAAGDTDFYKQMVEIGDQGRKRALEKVGAGATVLFDAKRIPQDQRQAFIASATPGLIAQGYKPEEIAQFDLSDAGIDGQIAQAMSVSDKIKQAHDNAKLSEDIRHNQAMESRPQFDPVSGQFVGPATAGGGMGGPVSGGSVGPLSVASVAPHIVAQESQGNYSARNRETGAMGAYQVMPQTGKALAQRLGLPWQPQLMTASTPDAKAYQDKIGQAAIQEAIDASGGDPMVMAQYYHGGSNRDIWGPKTQQYGREVVSRLGGGSQGAPPRRGVGNVPREAAPSGFRWKSDGSLEPIPGGPSDKSAPGSVDRKGEADLRKEFNNRPEVKDFKARRQSWQTIDRLGKAQAGGKPTAQNDMALVFQFMKMLDPGSVVREGEFASAQNAAGVPDQIRNAYNKAVSGELMNPQQRKSMVNSAATVYTSARDLYNPIAQEYQGYARDYGLDPNRIAQEYRPTRAPRQASGGQSSGGGWGKAQVVQ